MEPGRHVSRARLRWGVLALLAIVALVAWVVTRGGASSSGATPRVLSEAELVEAAEHAPSPIYWAGSAINAEYGLLETDGGHRVLYVPAGTGSDAMLSKALTIGSYPMEDPVGEVRTFARRPGAIVRRGQGGGMAVSNRSDPSSVYFAAPEVEVEVYAPTPGRAMRLALSGRVRPVR